MFTTLFFLSLLVALTPSVLAQSDDTFTVYTPSLIECQPATINWTDTGNSPYEVFIVSADNPCDNAALMYLGNQTSPSVTCTPSITAGTRVDILVLDSIGDEAWSATITVGSSGDSSCLASNSTSHPSATAPGSSHGTPTHYSSSTPSTTFAPVGAAGSGLVGNSGVLSTSPLSSSFTLLGAVMLAAVTFTL